eukprot:m.1193 g.1193  ORF g.1193 m.1193 type:complete len:66 (+) comp5861_c0_seq1:57-254(+)
MALAVDDVSPKEVGRRLGCIGDDVEDKYGRPVGCNLVDKALLFLNIATFLYLLATETLRYPIKDR